MPEFVGLIDDLLNDVFQGHDFSYQANPLPAGDHSRMDIPFPVHLLGPVSRGGLHDFLQARIFLFQLGNSLGRFVDPYPVGILFANLRLISFVSDERALQFINPMMLRIALSFPALRPNIETE